MLGNDYIPEENETDPERIGVVISAFKSYWKHNPDLTFAEAVSALHNDVIVENQVTPSADTFDDSDLLTVLQREGIEVEAQADVPAEALRETTKERIDPIASLLIPFWKTCPDRSLAEVACYLHNQSVDADDRIEMDGGFSDDYLMHSLRGRGIDVYSHLMFADFH